MSSSFKCFTGVQVEFLNNFPNILMNHSFAKVVKNVYIFVGNSFSILQIKKEICNCNFHILNYTEEKDNKFWNCTHISKTKPQINPPINTKNAVKH